MSGSCLSASWTRSRSKPSQAASSADCARRGVACLVVERVGAAPLLAPDEIDRAPVDERQDPGARLGALGPEAGRGAPDAEERLLHGILGEPVVAQDAEREPVGDAADAVVQLGQRALVAAGDERDESLVREVSEVLAHGPGSRRVGQRYHGGAAGKHRRLVRRRAADRFGSEAGSNRLRPDRANQRRFESLTQGECNEESNGDRGLRRSRSWPRPLPPRSRSAPGTGSASSHREAPLIAEDPSADLTDLYAFRSPDKPNTVTLLANVIPGEDPAAGPNWYTFSPGARYNIKIDTNGDVKPNVIYRFQFQRKTGPFFLGDTAQPFTVTRIAGGKTTVVAKGTTPPNNIGPRSTPNYHSLVDEVDRLVRRRRLEGVRRPAGRSVLRRHRRDLRPRRDPQGHGQRRRREGLLLRLRRPHDRRAGADRRPEREERHDRRLGVGRAQEGRRRAARRPATAATGCRSTGSATRSSTRSSSRPG